MAVRPCRPEGPPSRRRFLLGTAGAAALAAAQHPAFAARAAFPPLSPALSLERFLDVSQTLTGQQALDPGIGRRILDYLAGDPAEAERLERLMSAVEDLRATTEASEMLKDERFRRDGLDGLARELMKGWYTGLLGPEDGRVFAAYPDALMYRAVLDFHNVPSFCGGVPHFWAHPPAQYPNPFLES